MIEEEHFDASPICLWIVWSSKVFCINHMPILVDVSKLLPQPTLILAYALSCFRLLNRLIRKLKCLSEDFGGAKVEIRGRCIGCLGIHYVYPKLMVESDLRSWEFLTKHSLQKNFGVSCIIHPHFSIRCSSPNTSPGARY